LRDALSSQWKTHSWCKKETGYEEEYQETTQQNSTVKTAQPVEAKETFAFYIGG
jgi:hypothetical protein